MLKSKLTEPRPAPDLGTPWVKSLLASMTIEEKAGQLLHPFVRPDEKFEDIEARFPAVRVGGIFIFSSTAENYLRITGHMQKPSGRGGAADSLPFITSSDLESGAGRMIKGCTAFPDMMGVAAADSEELAFEMGRATAREARAHGLHWNFGPVVDLNYNPYNPITNTRSLGDDPVRVARISRAMILGMQAEGLCATAKHFPGDGWDDRDQHLATSVNPLSPDEWERSSGIPFRAAIEAGVFSVMIGHIAMPSLDPGDPADPGGAPPSVLSRAITTDFLRGKLGFGGLVITDAIEMNGSVSRVKSAYELIVRQMNAGCDMILFSQPKRDHTILVDAVKRGDISTARLDEACGRVLALKESMGFASDPASALPAERTFISIPEVKKTANAGISSEEHESFSKAAVEMAARSITVLRGENIPLGLGKGSRVLAVHLGTNPDYNASGFDALLRAKGIEVESKTEAIDPSVFRSIDYTKYDAIIFVYVIGPTWGTNLVRPAGTWFRIPWFVCHEIPPCPIINISFGTPYLIHDLPWSRNYINAYSPDAYSQEACLKVLLGEAEARGSSPVDLGRCERMGELLRKDILG